MEPGVAPDSFFSPSVVAYWNVPAKIRIAPVFKVTVPVKALPATALTVTFDNADTNNRLWGLFDAAPTAFTEQEPAVRPNVLLTPATTIVIEVTLAGAVPLFVRVR